VTRRLRCLVLDDPRAVALGGEPVQVGEQVVGQVTSGGYGYTAARSIAYAYIPVDAEGGVTVAVDGERIPAQLASGPLHDPKGTRIRA
jgi:glycine cleavage system aminomethyltransferase T